MMITETRQSRTSLSYYEQRHRHSRRQRRRHHTLDNSTLDKFNFICIPLHVDESHIHSSASFSNLNMVNSVYSTMPASFRSNSAKNTTTTRRVRFQIDTPSQTRHVIEIKPNGYRHSSEDVRLRNSTSIHRVEVEIPLSQAKNPWLNVDSSEKQPFIGKTRAITTQKIDINRHNNGSTRLQGIAPFIQAEIHQDHPSSQASNYDQTRWYRQLYQQLHKPQIHENQQNPYEPTYQFPEGFNGDLELIEDHIRKTATKQKSWNDYYNDSTYSNGHVINNERVEQTTTSKRNNGHIHKVLRFQEFYPSSIVSSSPERSQMNEDGSSLSSFSRSSTNQALMNSLGSTPNNGHDENFTDKNGTQTEEISVVTLPNGSSTSQDLSTSTINEQQSRNKTEIKVESDGRNSVERFQSRLLSQPIYQALALHNFYAQTNRELSFKKGDIILVIRRINDDWLEGEHLGNKGIFPLNHVELFPIEKIEQNDDFNNFSNGEIVSAGEAIVKYDFIPQKTFELQLRKGDKVTLLRRLDDNWYEGRLNHIEGIFPSAYVETVREPPEIVSLQSHKKERSSSSKENTPESQSRTSKEKIEVIPESNLKLQKCEVLYDYTPQNPDELEIHVGDIINIIEMCDDGWFCGMMEKSEHPKKMIFGTFPGNYVQLLED